MGAMVFHLCREPASARALEEEALGIATEQGFPLWIGGALCGLGNAIAELGSFDEGMERVREGLALYRATGGQTNTAFVLGGVATACLANGRLDEAEQAVDEALGLVERNLETFYAAELWRLKGEVTLARTADERRRRGALRARTHVGPSGAGEVARASGRHEPCPAVRSPRREPQRRRGAGADLRVVRRRPRHPGSPGRAGAPRAPSLGRLTL